MRDRAYYADKLHQYRVPIHDHQGLLDYIMHGRQMGGFLTCVVCNDLFGAFGKADWVNKERMSDIVSFIYNVAPNNCWGDEVTVTQWMKSGGMLALNKSELERLNRAEAGVDE